MAKQCRQENDSVAMSLYDECGEGSYLDVGCGTGLALYLLNKLGLAVPGNYTGIDISPDMVRLCRASFPQHSFVLGDAMKELQWMNRHDYVTALFSANYLPPEALDVFLDRARRKVFLVHYNRPYLPGSASCYQGVKGYFWIRHWRNRMRWLGALRRRGFQTWKLLGQEYYWLSVGGKEV